MENWGRRVRLRFTSARQGSTALPAKLRTKTGGTPLLLRDIRVHPCHPWLKLGSCRAHHRDAGVPLRWTGALPNQSGAARQPTFQFSATGQHRPTITNIEFEYSRFRCSSPRQGTRRRTKGNIEPSSALKLWKAGIQHPVIEYSF